MLFNTEQERVRRECLRYIAKLLKREKGWFIFPSIIGGIKINFSCRKDGAG